MTFSLIFRDVLKYRSIEVSNRLFDTKHHLRAACCIHFYQSTQAKELFDELHWQSWFKALVFFSHGATWSFHIISISPTCRLLLLTDLKYTDLPASICLDVLSIPKTQKTHAFALDHWTSAKANSACRRPDLKPPETMLENEKIFEDILTFRTKKYRMIRYCLFCRYTPMLDTMGCTQILKSSGHLVTQNLLGPSWNHLPVRLRSFHLLGLCQASVAMISFNV